MFSKYAWVIPLKDKKDKTSIVNAFQTIISKERKPNKKWVDQGSELYNQSFKDFSEITQKCTQHLMKENLLLLKDLLEL